MIWAIIIGMSIVTIVPRIIPVFLVDQASYPDWVNRWLDAIPYAALGALIFPGIMTVIPDQPIIGLIGGVIAIVIAFFEVNVIFAVLGAILTVYLLTM
ncbi:Branched-chain amino acid transport protein [Salinibacillus kushneri]|uniref:Branched-chain amino acid transport protein n=1 Tax=Salinibacillus kushneri TaxID=237682 RepID=A0A1I0ATI7_9BACI|nr:AzlD domain-containing protein [Salinibacillus kushneri]SES97740.1 Branched-chain amino acid transport protein [Salinibacillus kushneri]